MKKQTEKELLNTVTKLLKENGWNVAVIGGINVMKRGSTAYNFTLGIDFTGRKLKTK